MPFEHTWRWFGPSDPVTIEDLRQAGATGVVTALHHVPAGEEWTTSDIAERCRVVDAAGARWTVAESLPVHESIKTRTRDVHRRIDTYIRSLTNLGQAGVRTVCLNFMPVLDWSRTDLHRREPDGSISTSFAERLIAAFDLFILQRPSAEASYARNVVADAERAYAGMSAAERDELTRTILLGFPGSGEAYTVEGLRNALKTYDGIDAAQLRRHLAAFLSDIVPAAEKAGVMLAIHPDDPPWPVLGLPRAVSKAGDLRSLLAAAESSSNGLTLCTGSLGADPKNDVPSIARTFASRVNFVHLRNVRSTAPHDFHETYHLEGDVDLVGVIRALLHEARRRNQEEPRRPAMPMRPDHGHLMRADRERATFYPGYSLLGRLRGLAEIRGVEAAIEHELNSRAR